MTTKDLQEIARIANENEWERFEAKDISHFYEKPGFFRVNYEDNVFETHHINEIIFDPEFGKAFWGKDLVCEHNGNEMGLKGEMPVCWLHYEDDLDCKGIPAFQYYQRELGGLSDEERQKYMLNELRKRKGK
mgnify:CR=1 FL=1